MTCKVSHRKTITRQTVGSNKNDWLLESRSPDVAGKANHKEMTERDLRKLEGTIRSKMEEIKAQRVSLKDSGIGGLMNTLKKVDEALYEKILPEYKKMVAERNIFK